MLCRRRRPRRPSRGAGGRPVAPAAQPRRRRGADCRPPPALPARAACPARGRDRRAGDLGTGGEIGSRTRARHAEVHAALAGGLNLAQIGRDLGLDRRTVRRYARAAAPGDMLAAAPAARPSGLDPHLAYLRQRWEEGCHGTNQLYQEIRGRGYRGHPAHPAPLYRPPAPDDGPPRPAAPASTPQGHQLDPHPARQTRHR